MQTAPSPDSITRPPAPASVFRRIPRDPANNAGPTIHDTPSRHVFFPPLPRVDRLAGARKFFSGTASAGVSDERITSMNIKEIIIAVAREKPETLDKTKQLLQSEFGSEISSAFLRMTLADALQKITVADVIELADAME